MKREEIANEVNKHIGELRALGVEEIIISRVCSLENTTDCTIPVIVKSGRDNYESYNAIQEFLTRNISELIEVIPYDSFEAKTDDHFDEDSITIRTNGENL